MEHQSTPPQHMGAYMKHRYGGWIDTIPEITTSGQYELSPVTSATGNAFRIPSPNSASQYFVLEYRRKMGVYESSIPGSGLLVYRVNPAEDGEGNSKGPPDELYLFRPNGTATQNGQDDKAHFSAEADRTVFAEYTDPYPFLQDTVSTPGGIRIYDVGSAGDTITFQVCLSAPPSCGGKECGGDGCGGTCGTCSGGEFCVDGQCKDATSCKTYYSCIATCAPSPEGDACLEACAAALSQEGLADVTAFQNCLTTNGCYDKETNEEFNACLNSFCKNTYFQCFSGNVHQDCMALNICRQDCPADNTGTPDVDEYNDCASDCWSDATLEAQLDLQSIYDCGYDACPECVTSPSSPTCDECWSGAMYGECLPLFEKCVLAGEEGCGTVWPCVKACPDGECQQACYDEGSILARALYNELVHCLLDECPDSLEAAAWWACADEASNAACQSNYLACLQDGGGCVPKCFGKACGDDGCGGSCGSCEAGAFCLEGACETCTCEGKECGNDGCGNPCGTCPAGSGCTPEGLCVTATDACIPKDTPGCPGCACETCTCVADEYCCTTAWDMLCVQRCSESCGGEECPDICIPECDGLVCGGDGCGGTCGQCQEGWQCVNGGTNCAECTCDGKACGDDGCGNSCGTCQTDEACHDGACIHLGCSPLEGPGCDGCGCEACVCEVDPYCCETQWDDLCVAQCADPCGEPCPCLPDCAGKACGDDGCGGSCGTCPAETACEEGACVPVIPCDGVTYAGCCDEQVLKWCENDSLKTIDCTNNQAPNDVCGWKEAAGFYDCGGSGADPGGTNPLYCPGTCVPDCTAKECGNDGCDGSCGVCDAGFDCSVDGLCTPEPVPCDGVSFEGCCDEKVLKWCEDETLQTLDCSGNEPPNDVCGWNEAAGYYYCGQSGEDPSGSHPIYCPGACVPECTGKECGDDQCGGSCGSCRADASCVDGLCLALPTETAPDDAAAESAEEVLVPDPDPVPDTSVPDVSEGIPSTDDGTPPQSDTVMGEDVAGYDVSITDLSGADESASRCAGDGAAGACDRIAGVHQGHGQ